MGKRERLVTVCCVLVLTFFYVFMVFYRSSSQALMHHDEGSYAVQARKVVEGGMTLKGIDPYCNQPIYPLVISVLFKLFGIRDFWVRFPAMVGGYLILCLIFFWGCRLSSVRCGLLSALVLCVNPFFIFYCRSGLTETVFSFFLIGALFFLWSGLYLVEKRFFHFVLGGALGALAIHVKWNGFLALLFTCCYLALCFVYDAVKNRIRMEGSWKESLKRVLSGYGSLFWGLFAAGLIMMILLVPWIQYLRLTCGFRNVLRKFSENVIDFRIVIRRIPHSILLYLGLVLLWAKALLVTSAFGMARLLVKRRRERLFFLFWILFFFAFLIRYSPYPRLFFPILVSLSLPAGLFLDRCIERLDLRFRWTGFCAVSILFLLLGFLGIMPHVQGKLDGYREAAGFIKAREDIGVKCLSRMRENFYFYLPQALRIGKNPQTRALIEKGDFYILTDISRLDSPVLKDFMQKNEKRIILFKRFDFDLFEPFLFQPFYYENLKYFFPRKNIPIENHSIMLYYVKDACILPESWK